MANKSNNRTVNAPRALDIKGQPHQLSYITPLEAEILKELGGSGEPGPMGIPSFFYDEVGAVEGTTGTYGSGGQNQDFGGDDNDNDFASNNVTSTGLSKRQFQNKFGITNKNPYGNTGFTNFFDKISKALGGKGVDYSQQMRAMQPRGTVFQGGIISKGGVNQGMSSQDYMDTYGTPAEQIMQQQYDAYRNPFNQPDLDGYDPDYATATAEEMAQGKITRQGRTDRGSFLGPLEEVKREQSIADMVARAMMPMGTGMLDTTDTYLSSQVTPEMRARSSENPLASAFQALSGVDMKQAQTKVNQGINSLGDRLSALASGNAPQAAPTSTVPTPTLDPREMDPLSAPSNALTNRNAPNYGMEPTSYDMVQRQNRIPTPEAVPESIAIQRANEGLAIGPYQSVDMEGPIGRRYDLPSEELDAISRNYEIDGVTGPTPEEIDGFTPQPFGPDMDANASYRGSRATPVGPDMDALGSIIDPRGNQMAPTPGEGYGMFGPRTPDDLRSMGIEPTAQDLMDMQLSPAEILREQARGMDTSYQGTGLPSDLRQADQVGATAASTSLENFFEQNPDLGASLMNSREGQELNDLVGRNFGGFDKSQPIQTFIDPETAEIKVQGYDARTGGAKGFNIDASDFFGKQSFGEVLLDTLQAGGVEKLADESLAEKARRQNREFQEEKARREREGRPSINTLEQGLGNISFNRG